MAPSLSASGVPSLLGLFSVNHPAVVLETVKKAEESSSLVLRVVESWGGRRRIEITVAPLLRLRHVAVVNILEHEDAAIGATNDLTWDATAGAIRLVMRPFQILTLKLD